MEAAVDRWTVKLGHFYTLIGYEVVGAPENFFNSRAITMYNRELWPHTGCLDSYAATEYTTRYGGWTAGWETGFEHFANGSSFIGGVSNSLSDDVAIAFMTTVGDFGTRGSDGYIHSLVFDIALGERWNYVVQSDLLRFGSTNEDNIGSNQYIFYNFDSRTSLGARLEWWKTDTTRASLPSISSRPSDPGHNSPRARVSALSGRATDTLGHRRLKTRQRFGRTAPRARSLHRTG